MVHDNIVVFKGKKDGLMIVLDRDAGFHELTGALRARIADAGRFFGGAKTSIVFEGRILTHAEESELLDIIVKEANLNVSFVKDPDVRAPVKKHAAEEQPPVSLSAIFDPNEHMLTIHRGALRSGKSIRYAGSVLVLGDANPGSEIIAEGSIVVLGTAKGLVHAGCTGDTSSFVAALNLLPVQLRIADRATYIPEDMVKKGMKEKSPSYAYIEDGQIYIAPLE